eukprot:PhF_6_TR35765/c0_g1_i2/m.51966
MSEEAGGLAGGSVFHVPNTSSLAVMRTSNPTSTSLPWQRHILRKLASNLQQQDALLTRIRTTIMTELPKGVCIRCRREALSLDLIHDTPCRHLVCQDCVDSAIKYQKWYSQQFLTSRDLSWNDLGLLQGLTHCPKCLKPYVVIQKVIFQDGLATKGGLQQKKYVILKKLTSLVSDADNWVSYEVFENQRKGVISRFSKDNLLPTDFRGAWSTEGGDNVQDLDVSFPLPDDDWVWLNEWTPFEPLPEDPTTTPTTPPTTPAAVEDETDAEGWSYAFNWPTHGVSSWVLGSQWSKVAYPSYFVRRRRHRRACVRLDAQIINFATYQGDGG